MASARSTSHSCNSSDAADATLRPRLEAARADAETIAAKDESALILELAPHLERFLAELFGIADEVAALSRRHDELAPLHG